NGSHRDLIQKASVDASDGHGAAIAAAGDCLPQSSWPVCSHSQGLLDSVVSTPEPVGMRFHSNRIDTGIGSAASRHLAQSLVYIGLFVIQCLRTKVLASLAQPCL